MRGAHRPRPPALPSPCLGRARTYLVNQVEAALVAGNPQAAQYATRISSFFVDSSRYARLRQIQARHPEGGLVLWDFAEDSLRVDDVFDYSIGLSGRQGPIPKPSLVILNSFQDLPPGCHETSRSHCLLDSVTLYLDRADRALATARRNLEEGDVEACLNRAY